MSARRSSRIATACTAAALAVGCAGQTASASTLHGAVTTPVTPACADAYVAAFGPNVCVFNDTMSQAAIQADLNNIAAQQVPITSQFDSARYALFFEPGTYGSAADPLIFQVGYYTQVAGLGAMPQDTTINGAIDVFNNSCTPATTNCNSDDIFWRSLSNLTLNVDLPATPPTYVPASPDPYGAGCDNSTEMWSVSQADPIRRTVINGSVVFQDYCASENFASGGFIADSDITGNLNFYGNQQYMVRNSSIGGVGGCGGGNSGPFNMVYSGVQGAPAQLFTGLCNQTTVLAASPVSEEEPFLYTDANGNDHVFVPAVQTNSSGPSWTSGNEPGASIPLSGFFIANPSMTAGQISAQNALGKNIILTPGVYDLTSPIVITRPNTVVLGLGFATLVPQNGGAAIDVLPDLGVKLSGIIIDAGPVNSPVLLSVGTPGGGSSLATDPDLIQDVFFRIGGAETTPVSANVSLMDNASDSIIDDVWAWRADHGNAVGWTTNQANTGVEVTGANVTAYGLAVEHYQKTEVEWFGQGGTEVFFQNELPYDPPNQQAWMSSPTQAGYPAFRVENNVTSFHGYGMGSYAVFIQTPATIYDAEAFESPSVPGDQFTDLFTDWFGGTGGIASIIDGVGESATNLSDPASNPIDLPSYP